MPSPGDFKCFIQSLWKSKFIYYLILDLDYSIIMQFANDGRMSKGIQIVFHFSKRDFYTFYVKTSVWREEDEQTMSLQLYIHQAVER